MANVDMSEFIRAMRSVVNSQLSSYGLTEYRIGEVTKESPLEIKISDRITLTENNLILTEQVLKKQLDLMQNSASGDRTGARMRLCGKYRKRRRKHSYLYIRRITE